jgi:transposase
MEAFVKTGRMQSSRLIYRKDEFYLACTFLFEVEDIEPETYLGIDRGIEYVAAWKVIDTQLSSVASGMTEGRTWKSNCWLGVGSERLK